MTPSSTTYKEGGGILILNNNGEDIGGTIEDVNTLDENGKFKEIEYSNPDKLYTSIHYTPLELDTFSVIYQLYFALMDENYFIPTNKCELKMFNTCYKTCEDCIEQGDKVDHKCTYCAEGSQFLEGTHNCYFTAPPGYYLEVTTKTFKKCGDNCHSCTDPEHCVMCTKGYSKLSNYALNEDDGMCVPSCQLVTSRWNYNEDNEFECIQNKDYCPIERTFYNEKRKQCMKRDDTSDCIMDLYTDFPFEEQIKYFDKNIKDYYESNFIENKENFSILVYDYAHTSNEAFGTDNLTEIDLGECYTILSEQYSLSEKKELLIAQIDQYVEDDIVTAANFTFYKENGGKVEIDKCIGQKINLTSFILVMDNISLSSNEFEKLFLSHTDVLNPDDSFFHDKCHYYYSTENATEYDVTVGDRRTYYYQKLKLCGEGCTYKGIQKKYSKYMSTCECTISSSTIKVNSRVDRDFEDSITAFNAGTLKCMKETFSKEGIKKNVGSYLFIVIFISECAIFGLYLFNKNQIFRQFLVCHATKLFTSSVEDNNKTLTKTDNSKEGLKIINEKNGLKMLDNLNENITPHKMSSANNVSNVSNSNPTIYNKTPVSNRKTDGLLDSPLKQQSFLHNYKSNSQLDKLELYNAAQSDSRTFSYLSILRMKQFHPIYISFFSASTNVNKFVLISHFILELSSNFFFNAFFFSDSYISHTYRKGYSFGNEIPKSIFAFLASFLLCFLMKLMIFHFPDEEELILLKRNKGINIFKRKICYTIEKMNIIYYIVLFVFLVFFWLYVTSWCAIYQKSQLHWLVGGAFSFIISLIIPLIIAVGCAGLRRVGLKKKNELMFYLARLLESY